MPFMPSFPSKVKAVLCQVYMTLNANIFQGSFKNQVHDVQTDLNRNEQRPPHSQNPGDRWEDDTLCPPLALCRDPRGRLPAPAGVQAGTAL